LKLEADQAAEQRKKVAHGVNRGIRELKIQAPAGAAENCREIMFVLSPRWGLAPFRRLTFGRAFRRWTRRVLFFGQITFSSYMPFLDKKEQR
jgi:hypothetical protein